MLSCKIPKGCFISLLRQSSLSSLSSLLLDLTSYFTEKIERTFNELPTCLHLCPYHSTFPSIIINACLMFLGKADSFTWAKFLKIGVRTHCLKLTFFPFSLEPTPVRLSLSTTLPELLLPRSPLTFRFLNPVVISQILS